MCRAFATHIRAGEIIVERQSCQGELFTIRIIGYEDTGSDVEFGNGILDLGFGDPIDVSTENDFFTREIVDNQKLIRVSEFVIKDVAFPGPKTYTISFREFNRNADILNMTNSVNTPFYIETQVVIDGIQCNSSPVLTNPPVEGAVVGKRFVHNPGAVDPDGDSLSYKLVIPKQDAPNENFPNGVYVDGYQDPHIYDQQTAPETAITQDGTGPSTLTLDPITGELVWDAPALQGQVGSINEYNIAFIVEEWRQIEGEWYLLGYVTRDMQILVENADNEPPVLEIPADTCIEAGTVLEVNISGSDPDMDDIAFSSFGEVFEIVNSPATFSPTDAQPSPGEGTFRWETNCGHVRAGTYQINFKVSDTEPATGPPLADFGIWNVTVVAPAPQVVSAQAAPGRAVDLDWEAYSCGAVDDVRIQIWRKPDSTDFVPENCQIGIPPGYELVAEVDRSVVSYLDEGLEPGVNYCYRLVAVFPDGASSYASEEICAEMKVDAPVVTNVSVSETDENEGIIEIAWRSPFEIDESLFPPPYSYQVVRGTGFGENGSEEIISGIISDTSFVDIELNTLNEPFHYKIYLFDASGDLIDSSAVASSVRLEPTPRVGSIELDWQANVPWSITSSDFPYHYVYRNRVDPNDPGKFVLIDSVNVTASGLQYTDDGATTGGPLSDELEYCYYIETQGSYGNEKLNPPSFINLSQVACAQPNDTIPPCEPLAISIPTGTTEECEAQVAGKPCGTTDFMNRIEWEANIEGDCDNDVRFYNIYFSAVGQSDSTFNLVGTSTETFFEHTGLRSLAGCYRISAVDRSGNESTLSAPVCVENCPNYLLPNVFTPNGDGYNDTFRPLGLTSSNMEDFSAECPRFVQSVKVHFYNRWGKEVYAYESTATENSININWDGRTESGSLVSAGVYYYVADVTFITLDPALSQQTLKGWVHIMYEPEEL
uniref:Gliding motility-associated C-terminal domain-containing protein n=1 Tax=Roseihalotalea indica TaxID=2867963 RepID=A0AA49GQF9_9BACT|nr:gliding motility-associated C-terminal domain-containing protein [Tunicatimonas sp. TK19036]